MKNFESLFAELTQLNVSRPGGSGTARLLDLGVHEIGKKVLEEAGEVWLAAEHQSEKELAVEISQLLYYLQVLMISKNLKLEDIYENL